jgi:hypothetical protein
MRNTGRVASTTSRGGTDAAAASFREKTKVQKAGHETAFQRLAASIILAATLPAGRRA